jgi:redox-sensitive bicupin YhaK (pirin superfamily)
MAIRQVKRLVKAKPTLEGAGVRLHRAFGFGTTSDYDPFLLLDDFRNERPEDYRAGFPWHPHRGIETITPRYQDVKSADVAVVVDDDGTTVRVVCGSYRGTRGPVDDVAAKPVYLDAFRQLEEGTFLRPDAPR